MVPHRARRWVTEVMGQGSAILSARRLRLGSWHINHALEVVDIGGRTHQLVLRRWARRGWEATDPDYTVERETSILGMLGSTPVPAPVVVASDPLGARCDVPGILLTRLPGHPPSRANTDADSFCGQLAEALAEIHDVSDSVAKGLVTGYHLYYDRANAAPALWMQASPVWAQVTAVVRIPPPQTRMTFIHRDYHPENTLWSGGRLTGVVDWTQASWGPPGLDLGHMRWNLLLNYGLQVADRFLASYRAIAGIATGDQPYWDLVTLLDLLLDRDDQGDLTARDLSRLEDYAKTALRGVA